VFPNPAPHNEPHAAIDDKLVADDGLFFVAVDDAELVGTVMGGYDGHRGWIYTVAVAPDRRRDRIGSALVRHVEDALIERGCQKINLQVRTHNAGVIPFYEHLGYKVEEIVSMGKRVYEMD
jgi:ribosomal protein S18 acetylase RimI-like enzyme